MLELTQKGVLPLTIGEKIALRRRIAGLSQESLAARLGVSRQAVSRWETSESLPDAEKIVQLCQILGISADELLMENTPPSSVGNGSSPGPVPSGRQWASLAATLLLCLGALSILTSLLALFFRVWDYCFMTARIGWSWYIAGSFLFYSWRGLFLAAGTGMTVSGIIIRAWLRKNGF